MAAAGRRRADRATTAGGSDVIAVEMQDLPPLRAADAYGAMDARVHSKVLVLPATGFGITGTPSPDRTIEAVASRLTATSGRQPVSIPRRIGLIALWCLQVALAVLFLLAGGAKLGGVPAMVRLFAAIGVGQWFRYVTGLIEVGSAVALLVPALAPWGAVLLACTMLGGIATHLLIIGGSPRPPGSLLLGSLAVAWARRERLTAVLRSIRQAQDGP